MAIWLVARAKGARLPRRLIYVVDRRAVVDQATTEAERLRGWVEQTHDARRALGLTRLLPISTLRGQHVDNREWLEDPSIPAIVVGTVDMVGSRLLFDGYGVSRKMRPYHAGFLGADTLVVLDEAHLVPPFERLLRAIARDSDGLGPRTPAFRAIVPRLELLSLSATGREIDGALGLTSADLDHAVVRKRLDAPKRLSVHAPDEGDDLATSLARKAWALSKNGTARMRCIVYADSRENAQQAQEKLEEWRKGERKAGVAAVDVRTELFVGGRRVFEREAAASQLDELGFLATSKKTSPGTAFLFATSAAEVGVDLDADHLVCDLVSWERMVQRLGRVNRRGNGDAQVIVIEAPRSPSKAEKKALETPEVDRRKSQIELCAQYDEKVAFASAWRRALDALPRRNGVADASPGALQRARNDETLSEIFRAATTAEPLRPALSRALVDAWSMTSLREHTGRPEVQPWLRGWVEEKPQTSIVWRRHLPVMKDGSFPRKQAVEAFFEAAPPHAVETLETETYHAVSWLMARGQAVAKSPRTSSDDEDSQQAAPLKPSDTVAAVLTRAGELREFLVLADVLEEQTREEVLRSASPEERARLADRSRSAENERRERTNDRLERIARHCTIVVDRRLGGLSLGGLLDDEVGDLPTTIDDDDQTLCPFDDGVPRVRFRVWSTSQSPPLPGPGWRSRFRLLIHETEDAEVTCLVVDKWRHDAATEEDRSSARAQLLDEHESWAEERARSLAAALGLDDFAEMLGIAARLHDEGKRSKRWQRAFNAPTGQYPYAKTRGPINYKLLDGYRHEFGSLPLAEKDDRIRSLPEELQDLALHLIAAHHGFARPAIATRACDDAPPHLLQQRAQAVALRFARLQKRWGPWGLAWWEALLRAADQQASRDNDARDDAADAIQAEDA